MKKFMILALAALLATTTVSASYTQNDPKCNKECCKDCSDKCKEACKSGKCSKEECCKKCDDKKGCCKKKSKA